MSNTSDILFMYAETSVHVGGGESVGAIDLAIAREKYTDFPFIPSSGVKGAIRDWFSSAKKADGDFVFTKNEIQVVFGPESDASEHAGAAIFTDARILLFPVRSMKGVFAWTTCPFALNRLKRDYAIAGKEAPKFDVPAVAEGRVWVPEESACKVDSSMVLEEYTFDCEAAPVSGELISALQSFLPSTPEYAPWKSRLAKNLVILSDNDFKEFVKASTEVQTRIKIASDTKTVKEGALFYQENLPAESLMYSVVAAQRPFKKIEGIQTSGDVFGKLASLDTQRIQFGGNESIGKGFFALRIGGGK